MCFFFFFLVLLSVPLCLHLRYFLLLQLLGSKSAVVQFVFVSGGRRGSAISVLGSPISCSSLLFFLCEILPSPLFRIF